MRTIETTVAPNGHKTGLSADVLDGKSFELRLARLLTSIAFRNSRYYGMVERLEDATSHIVGIEDTASSRRYSLIRTAIAAREVLRPMLRPISHLPITMDIRRTLSKYWDRLALSRDDDLVNQAGALAHSREYEMALVLLEKAARVNANNPRI